MASRRLSVPVIIGLVVAAFFTVVLPVLTWAARVWTDYLWFVDLGQEDVFVTRIVSQLSLGAIFSFIAFGVLYANLRIARVFAPKVARVSLPETVPVQVEMLLDALRRGTGALLGRIILWGSVLFAVTSGGAMASQWQTIRLWLARVPFAVTDPQFGIDVSLWVFTLPAAELVLSWTTDVLVATLVFTLVVHFLDGAIQPWARIKGFAPHVKAHVSVLAALLVLTRAFGYWIDIYNLNLSPRGQVTGASYTDVVAQLPALRILIVISIVTALLLLLNIRYRGWRLPAIALGVWVTAAIVVGGVWPSVVQQLVVTPNEASREAPYIERNIASTRAAFGLSDVKGASFPAGDDLTAKDILDDRATLSNVRLWDPDIVKQSFGQLETIRPYYEFHDVDVDRYVIDGQMRQVLVSAREIKTSLLAEQAQTWVNRHLVYTHGAGIVMAPSNEFDSRGLPRFIIGDIPPKVASSVASGSPDLKITQPRIYFGEDTTDYAIVNTGRPEFDYPEGDENAFYEYEHDGGVEIGALPRRIAWALRLGSSQVLFSEYLKPESRILLYRDLDTRLDRLAPWLIYEDDPYPVLVDGRITWIIDAYTASDRYPYSQQLPGGTNYLRNSVKVTVDAFTGAVTFYAFDSEDPVLKAWAKVFPSLITPAEKIPEGVRAHFRFPQGVFSAQAEVYRTYHMTNANTFYNKEDQWEIPGVRQGVEMEPFFVLLQLPGTEKEHFYLMQPYTPRNRDNMIGWMAVSSDPENYGEHTVYQFPKQRVIFGPEQISARINQDPIISAQLSLWNQRGSSVLFGKMQVIPIKESIVYVQPLFLQAEKTAIPELTRVVVAYSDKVEMEASLEAALLKVFGEEAPAPSTDTTGEPGPGPAGEGEKTTAASDAKAAAALYQEAVSAQKKGDWATYGARLAELGRVLERMASREESGTE